MLTLEKGTEDLLGVIMIQIPTEKKFHQLPVGTGSDEKNLSSGDMNNKKENLFKTLQI